MEQAAQFKLRLDASLRIRQSAAAEFVNRGFLADTGQDIGEHQARGCMHDDIAERDGLKPKPVCQGLRFGKASLVLAIIIGDQANKDMIVKGVFQLAQRGVEGRTAKSDQDTLGAIIQHILKREVASPFHRPAFAERQQTAELPEGRSMPRIGEQFGSIHQDKPRGDEVAQPQLLRRTMSANNACKRIPVSNGKPAQPDLARPGHQLFSM